MSEFITGILTEKCGLSYRELQSDYLAWITSAKYKKLLSAGVNRRSAADNDFRIELEIKMFANKVEWKEQLSLIHI